MTLEGRPTHWYSRFGIEEPFPWLFVAGCAVMAVAAEIIVFAGINQMIDCDLGW